MSMTKARRLRELLRDARPLVSPGVYDGYSARLVEAMGFKTAATTGAGLTNSRIVQPDIDLDTFEVRARVQLSTSAELLLRLRWIAILRGRVGCSLAGTGGVHTAEDALKLVAAGADVTQMCSALLRHGPGRLAEVLDGMEAWLDVNEYESIEQLKGSMSQAFCPEPAAFERAGYMQALVHWTGKKW